MRNFVAYTYITYGCHYVSVNASKAELCIPMTELMLQKNTAPQQEAFSYFTPKIKATICIVIPPVT